MSILEVTDAVSMGKRGKITSTVEQLKDLESQAIRHGFQVTVVKVKEPFTSPVQSELVFIQFCVVEFCQKQLQGQKGIFSSST